MPFGFLAPLFLAAAAAVIIPIVVHLRRREQRNAIRFPSLMFLRRVPHRSTSRRRIHHWPLLLLRVLALILIAAAFARPLLKDDLRTGAGNSPARELVILLDRSYSMGAGDAFERAKQVAIDTIAALRPIDRASVVAFDAGAHALTDATSDKDRLTATVSDLRVGDAGTRYAPAIRLAAALLDASLHPQKEVLLISDMQRAGWDDDPAAKLSPGATLRTVHITSPAMPNLAIADVEFERSVDDGRERVAAVARIVNRGSDPAGDVTVSLELDGRATQSITVTVPASGAATVPFTPFALTLPIRTVVRLPADGLAADNERNALLTPGRAIPVLVQGQNAAANLFLLRALALAKDPSFDVTARTGTPTAQDLQGKRLVILNDVPVPSGAAGARLQELVAQGGGLIVAVGERSSQAAWNDDARALLPARPNGAVDRARDGGIPFGSVESSHPVFDVFRAPRSGDLLAPRFYRHASLDELTGDSVVHADSDVLARFGDGGAALLERRVGEGRVLLFAAALDDYWSDLPVQPVYLPLMHRMVLHAATWEDTHAARVVGDAVGLDAGDYTAVSPSGRRIALEGDHPVLPVDERGFHEVRLADNAATVVETIAANVDVAESDFTPLNPTVLTAAVQVPAGDARARGAAVASGTSIERERSQSLWWYLMLAGFALLAAETVVSNYLSRRPVQREA